MRLEIEKFIEKDEGYMRRTKIICTIGPASCSEEVMRELLLAGLNVARMNFSHGTHESHAEMIARFRKVRDELKLPAAVFATIDSAAKSDAFDIEELIVHNEVTGEVFKAHITSYWYEYKLTVIDRFGNPDTNYPALPGIKSKKQFKAGAVVAVALPYGDLTPAIIGEVEL